LKLVLESPFAFKSVTYTEIETSNRIRVKERRLIESLGSLSEMDNLLSLCASICDMDTETFDQVGDEDFEKIAQHVVTLLERRAEKKSADPAFKRRDRNRKSREIDAPRVRVHGVPDA
jgi:hypothetical protein